jgi:predicted dehydrogenase
LLNPNRFDNLQRGTTMEKIRIGVVGFGAWGPNHVRNLRAQEACKVVRISDLSEGRLAAARKMFPDVETTTKADDVLEASDLDAVVVATPLIAHHDLVKRALLADKHVLCEKPLTRTSAEASELTQLAQAKGLTLMVGHVFMFNPGINYLKSEIDRGELGRIYYLDLVRTNLGPIRQDVGAIYDLASHDVSICNYLLNAEPNEVSANVACYLQSDREDVAFLTLFYPNQVVCNIHVSWLDPRKVRQITVVGNSKMAVWDDMNTAEPIRIYDKGVSAERTYTNFGEFHMVLRDGNIVIPKVRMFEPLMQQAAHFVSCVHERRTPVADGRHGTGVVKVLETAMKSMADGGRRTAVPRG